MAHQAASTPQLSAEEAQQRRLEVEENLSAVRERVLRATEKRLPRRDTRLVAVSKTKPSSDVMAAYDIGQRHFGENYVQELVAKAPELPPDIQWHFIGHLQSNKCKALADIPNLAVIETIDTLKLANMLDKACSSRTTPMGVFIQVNTSGEPQKGGIEPDDIFDVAKHIKTSCTKLNLLGLMTIGMIDRDETPNPDFVCLAECRRKLLEQMPELGDLEMSMGMSSDYEHAIELGSTNVRVGSTIFGARQRH